MMSWPLAWSSFSLRILRFGKCDKSLRKKKKWKFSKRKCSKIPIVNTMEMIHMVHSGLPTLGFLFPYSEAGEASTPSMVIFFPPPFSGSMHQHLWGALRNSTLKILAKSTEDFWSPFLVAVVFCVLVVSQKPLNFTMSQKWRWAANDIGMHLQLVTDIFGAPIEPPQ